MYDFNLQFFQLRRYRDERGRGDAREGGELHDILFGDSSQEEGAGPSSPYYDGSTEFSTEVNDSCVTDHTTYR